MNHILPHPSRCIGHRHALLSFIIYHLLFIISAVFVSCSDNEEYNPYNDWQERNTEWFRHVADTARMAINAAKAEYGDAWQEHCDWRMYKSLRKSPSYQSGIVEDSICVRIVKPGTGTHQPLLTDVVKVAFRGWLMPTQDAAGNTFEKVFSQTFYGAYNEQTAASTENTVSSFTEGFETALQYMTEGAEWMVCIPYSQFYNDQEQGSGTIPAYSSVRFRIILMKVY